MLYKELIELFDMLDSASASGSEVPEKRMKRAGQRLRVLSCL